MTKLPSVTINGLALSDLFFNSKLEHYNEMLDMGMKSESIGTQEIQIALKQDVIEFISDLGIDVSPDALVEDFNNRL